MSKKMIALVLIYPVAVAAVAVAWVNSRLNDEMAIRPPVAVIDEAAFVTDNLKPGSSTEQLEALLVRSEAVAEQLSDHGYIVFRKQHVYATPEGVEAKP